MFGFGLVEGPDLPTHPRSLALRARLRRRNTERQATREDAKMPKADGAAAVSHVDPFCDEFLADPYPFHEALREAGAGRVAGALRHLRLCAPCRGAGGPHRLANLQFGGRRRPRRFPTLETLAPAEPHSGGRPSAAYPQPHRAQPRAVGQGDGGPARRLQGRGRTARGGLVGRRRVDAIADIAEAYPLSVFPRAVGLGPEGLENLLPYGTMVFNAFGPRNAHFEASMRGPPRWSAGSTRIARARTLSPDGLGATIWAAVDTGEISAQEAPLLVRSLLSAGLDTTIIGIGNGLYALAANPGGMAQALRENPSLVRSAFDEILRWEAPVQTFFRTTTAPVELGGIAYPPTPRSCCSSPPPIAIRAVGNSPSDSTSARRASGHVAFGAGIHMCVGQMLARLESEMVLAALLARFARIEIAGEPKRKLNNTLRQFASLPVELTPA